jgi:hypothetical protein
LAVGVGTVTDVALAMLTVGTVPNVTLATLTVSMMGVGVIESFPPTVRASDKADAGADAWETFHKNEKLPKIIYSPILTGMPGVEVVPLVDNGSGVELLTGVELLPAATTVQTSPRAGISEWVSLRTLLRRTIWHLTWLVIRYEWSYIARSSRWLTRSLARISVGKRRLTYLADLR